MFSTLNQDVCVFEWMGEMDTIYGEGRWVLTARSHVVVRMVNTPPVRDRGSIAFAI